MYYIQTMPGKKCTLPRACMHTYALHSNVRYVHGMYTDEPHGTPVYHQQYSPPPPYTRCAVIQCHQDITDVRGSYFPGKVHARGCCILTTPALLGPLLLGELRTQTKGAHGAAVATAPATVAYPWVLVTVLPRTCNTYNQFQSGW